MKKWMVLISVMTLSTISAFYDHELEQSGKSYVDYSVQLAHQKELLKEQQRKVKKAKGKSGLRFYQDQLGKEEEIKTTIAGLENQKQLAHRNLLRAAAGAKDMVRKYEREALKKSNQDFMGITRGWFKKTSSTFVNGMKAVPQTIGNFFSSLFGK